MIKTRLSYCFSGRKGTELRNKRNSRVHADHHFPHGKSVSLEELLFSSLANPLTSALGQTYWKVLSRGHVSADGAVQCKYCTSDHFLKISFRFIVRLIKSRNNQTALWFRTCSYHSTIGATSYQTKYNCFGWIMILITICDIFRTTRLTSDCGRCQSAVSSHPFAVVVSLVVQFCSDPPRTWTSPAPWYHVDTDAFPTASGAPGSLEIEPSHVNDIDNEEYRAEKVHPYDSYTDHIIADQWMLYHFIKWRAISNMRDSPGNNVSSVKTSGMQHYPEELNQRPPGRSGLLSPVRKESQKQGHNDVQGIKREIKERSEVRTGKPWRGTSSWSKAGNPSTQSKWEVNTQPQEAINCSRDQLGPSRWPQPCLLWSGPVVGSQLGGSRPGLRKQRGSFICSAVTFFSPKVSYQQAHKALYSTAFVLLSSAGH